MVDEVVGNGNSSTFGHTSNLAPSGTFDVDSSAAFERIHLIESTQIDTRCENVNPGINDITKHV